jgi:hypothetical protein
VGTHTINLWAFSSYGWSTSAEITVHITCLTCENTGTLVDFDYYDYGDYDSTDKYEADYYEKSYSEYEGEYEKCLEVDEYGKEIEIECSESADSSEKSEDEEDYEFKSDDEECEDMDCFDEEDLEQLSEEDAQLPDWLKAQILTNIGDEVDSVEVEEKIPFKAEISEMTRLGEITISFT